MIWILKPYYWFDLELNKRKIKAQEKGDLAEEAKLCNAVGELLFQYGKKIKF